MIEHMFDRSTADRPDRAAAALRLEAVRERIRATDISASDVSDGLPQSLRSLRTSVDRLRELDWTSLTLDDAREAAVEIEHLRRTVDAVFAGGLTHLDSGGGVESASGLGLASWLASRTRGSRVATKRMVAAGRTLEQFTRFSTVLEQGEITIGHVLVLHDASNPRIADQLLEAEITLLELARSCTVEQFRRGVRAVVARIDVDGPRPDCSDTDIVSMNTDSAGVLHLRGSFSGHNAITVRQAINEEMQRQRRCATVEQETGRPLPGPGILRSRALAQLIRDGLSSDPGTSSAPRTEAILVFPADDAVCDHHGEAVDPTTAAVLACDAFMRPILTDADGTPLFAGRGVRYATLTQRRALLARDGGCVFPGCDAPASWCDAHHVIPWDDGARSDLSNLALLCRRHHGLAHSRDWKLITEHLEAASPAPRAVNRNESVRFVWITPDGRRIEAQHRRSRRTAA